MVWDYRYIILLIVFIISIGFFWRSRPQIPHQNSSHQPTTTKASAETRRKVKISTKSRVKQRISTPDPAPAPAPQLDREITIQRFGDALQTPPTSAEPVSPLMQPFLSLSSTLTESQSVMGELQAAGERHESDLFFPLKAGLQVVQLVRLEDEWKVSLHFKIHNLR